MWFKLSSLSAAEKPDLRISCYDTLARRSSIYIYIYIYIYQSLSRNLSVIILLNQDNILGYLLLYSYVYCYDLWTNKRWTCCVFLLQMKLLWQQRHMIGLLLTNQNELGTYRSDWSSNEPIKDLPMDVEQRGELQLWLQWEKGRTDVMEAKR